jgi:ferredoxin
MWRVDVDSACIGSGSCVGVAPNYFAMDAGHRSHPTRTDIEPDDTVLDAAASCPVEAIAIVDLDTGEPIDP